ncbi:MAG: hypothetical protein VX777_09595 [Chlamydiota bacterium]|nr:hypothetical protein [Chlamydiota bacterium]
MNINPCDYPSLSLKERLDILDKDEDFNRKREAENKNHWQSSGKVTVHSDLFKITSPDNNGEHIQKIQNLYYNLSAELERDFLCGACTENCNYLLFKAGDNVTIQSYDVNEQLQESKTLNPSDCHETELAGLVARFTIDKFVNSAWTPHCYANNDNIHFTQRTPGLDLNQLLYGKKGSTSNILKGEFPNNKITSTLKIGNEYIDTIDPSAFKYSRVKSARKTS